ncbi:unnamed protein product [Protopolystoma xenopodis]|uniref:Phosphate carrier protein, mitochondrial n=1 Tax=Protopolystoma xenopodis TaxID=117903 RepID=A0A3S4ZRB3_9PLAT|nr:unnamed protein product [Protopolystoma xenopodis]
MSSQPHSQEICKYGSLTYYGYCGLGGVLSCGITHTAIVPLDLVKCRIQVDPAKYKNIGTGFRVTLANEGIRGLGLGWAPTFFGYSMQGLGKFGFYEENAYIYRSLVYGLASASAEFFADIMLSPMEALKVRMQTQPGWCRTLREGLPRMMREEGLYGFYKSIVPLWSRQIPYTVMKFVSFEAILKTLYDSWPRPRDECSFPEQLTLTFSAGYLGYSLIYLFFIFLAGVLCAIVSHPADTLVSKLNKDPDARLGDLVKRLGFFGLWGGLGPRIIMIGTLTGLQWFIYDGFKVAVGLPRPPPLQMPESLRLKLEQKDD